MVIQQIPNLCPPCQEPEQLIFEQQYTQERIRIDCSENILMQIASNKYCNNAPECKL